MNSPVVSNSLQKQHGDLLAAGHAPKRVLAHANNCREIKHEGEYTRLRMRARGKGERVVVYHSLFESPRAMIAPYKGCGQ